MAACRDRFGRIDLLVNNVGGSHPGGPVDMPEEVWDRQIDFNLKTAFLGCKHALPIMEAGGGGGAVVNISSIAGLRMGAARVHSAYSASKAGIIGFSKSVAMAYAARGIRCNTVVPGLMHTPLVEHRLVRQLGANDAEALIAKRHASVPVRPHGQRLGRGARRAVPALGRGEATSPARRSSSTAASPPPGRCEGAAARTSGPPHRATMAMRGSRAGSGREGQQKTLRSGPDLWLRTAHGGNANAEVHD